MNIHQKVLEQVVINLEKREELLQKLIEDIDNQKITDEITIGIREAWKSAYKIELENIQIELRFIRNAVD